MQHRQASFRLRVGHLLLHSLHLAKQGPKVEPAQAGHDVVSRIIS